jgi:formyltetrahydrofolate deformylase
MQVVITAVGPDNRGLADPIVHHVTSAGANIAEIQMYDHDAERVFAMLLRIDWPVDRTPPAELRQRMNEIGRDKGLSIRTWSPDEHNRPPRLALCVTHRPEPPLAVLRAIRDNRLRAAAVVMIGNQPSCRAIAEQFGVDWHHIGDAKGNPDNDRLVELLDRYEVDYVVLARYMRIVPAAVCWKYAGGRIINLHHGLLPAFPGARPYHDAYSHRMLTYGATVHFIVPELDAGDQIIHQDTFTVPHGTTLEQIMHIGQTDHEPACLFEGVRRVVDREVSLHYHRVIAAKKEVAVAERVVGEAREP